MTSMSEKIKCMNDRGHYVYINRKLVERPNYLRQNNLKVVPNEGGPKAVLPPPPQEVKKLSIEYSPAMNAIRVINNLKSVDEVTAFVQGEERKGVLNSANERINDLNNAN